MSSRRSSQPLLVARAARIAIDDVAALSAFDLETTGHKLVVAGDAAPLLAALSGVPQGVMAAASHALLYGELVPISGSARANGGELSLCGRDVRRREHLLHVGAAPFDPPVPLDWTVDAYVLEATRLGLAAQGIAAGSREVTRRTQEALERAGLAGARKRKIRSLQVPERRVLMIASALAADPEVIVAEQPLYGLEGEAAQYVLGALDAASSDRGLVASVGRFSPGSSEGILARSASDLAVFANAELSSFGRPDALLAGARFYRVTVRTNADALVRALAEKGAVLEGGPTRFAITLKEGQDASLVLQVASEVRSAVVEIVPLV